MRLPVLVLVAALTALDTPASTQPVFRAGTTLVEVSAVVTR